MIARRLVERGDIEVTDIGGREMRLLFRSDFTLMRAARRNPRWGTWDTVAPSQAMLRRALDVARALPA